VSASLWLPDPFIPRRWLRGPHLQTLASTLLPRHFSLPEPQERLFQVEAGVRVLCHCHWQPDPRAALTLILVHGFEGSSSSHYILGAASKALVAGMNVVRMNIRNCGNTQSLGPTLYHSGLSADIGMVARELVEGDQLPCIAIAGFSLGGNQVLKLAGEMGNNVPAAIRAFAAVSPGMDLIPSSFALHQWQNRLYEWNFLLSLRRTLRRKAMAFPEVCRPFENRWYRSVRDFDHRVTAPHFGFLSADDYYNRASASPLLPHIARPTLIIHSTDDPFILMQPATRAAIVANPNITFAETSAGGHCGFISRDPADQAYWAERQLVRFFLSAAA
jgi:predicted alpha/beta-fold hydrolase